MDVDRPPSHTASPLPKWAELSFHRCPSCTLDPEVFQGCPAALDLIEVVQEFSDRDSTEQIDVQVIASNRSYTHRCDVQMALRSLIGLVMASSACPYLSRLKGMARHHLPFSDRVETTRRTASFYLLEQFFLYRDGHTPDLALSGLRMIYDRLHEVNTCFAHRLRAAVSQDASVNAIVSLSSLANLISFSLDDDLEELRRFLQQ